MSRQTLSKSELVAAIAVKQPDLSKKAIAEVVRAARNGRNPRTGETLQIAASVAPKFSPGKVLRSAVAGK